MIWENFRYEDGYTRADEVPDLGSIGPFRFATADYRQAIGEQVLELDPLASLDRATEKRWRASRCVGGRLWRLLRRPTTGQG